MKTELIDKGQLSSELVILLEKTDYLDKFNTELKKYKNKAHLKGFRKGKTPLSAIKKMYGQSVLADVINQELQSGLSHYIVDNKLDILGDPLPSERQVPIDFNINELSDYEFIFDLGLAPEFEVKGISETDEYEEVVVKFDDSMVDEEIESLRKRFGAQVEVDGTIEDSDIVSIEITEQNPTDGREAFVSEVTVMPDRLTEEYQNQIVGKKLGHEFSLHIFNIEKDTTEEYVNKYFLKDAPKGVTADFNGVVSAIKRLKPAEINQEFFNKAFGEDKVKTIDEAKEHIQNELVDFYGTQGKSITKRYILENLLDIHDFELPDEFLKRWLLSSNENATAEDIEKDYDAFVKNLKWTLIKQKIAKQEEIEITPEDIKAGLRKKIERQFAQYGGYPGINYDDMVNRLAQNQETVQKEYEELLAESVLEKALGMVKLKTKKVSLDEYKGIVTKLQENIQ
jgi:trigger factor